MAAALAPAHKLVRRRQRNIGIVCMVLGVAVWLLFARAIPTDWITEFGLVPGGRGVTPIQLSLPTLVTLNILAVGCILIGGWQLARRGERYMNLALALAVGLFVFAFLTWAAGNKSLNLAGMLATSLRAAVPLTLGALAGILCERAGVVNIGIEGMMLIGAFVSTVVGSLSGNSWLGMAVAVAVGALTGLIHATLSIRYRVNQIISGTVINILAVGLTSYLSSRYLQVNQDLNNPGVFPPFAVPGLSQIPILGPVLFNNNVYFYAMFLLLALLQFGLFRTRWGLRLRAVGEHPKAADTLGIRVNRTRYLAVILGGIVAGFAGSYFTLGSVGRFDEMMTAGRGFIALAAMIFGNWMPFGAFGAALLFGFADSLASRMAILNIPIPSQFLLMAPYIVTMTVLAGVIGRSQPPEAAGVPYTKE